MSDHPHPVRPRLAAAVLAMLALGACGRAADSDTLIAKARAYQQQGETGSAVIELKNAIQREPGNKQARELLGAVYLEQGDALSAEKELRRALALDAKLEHARIALGKAMLMQGRFDALLAEFADGALSAEVLALRAQAQLGNGVLDKAREGFDAALKLKPGMADALLGRARLAMADQQPAEAAALVEQALADDPVNLEALRFKGDLLRLQGKPRQAIELQRDILKARPSNAQAHIDIASLLIDAGKFDEARAELAAARKNATVSVGLLHAQALLDFREGKHATALASLQQILRTAPEHMPSQLLAGAVQLALGAPEQAEQHLRKFLAAYPAHPYATKLQASIALQAGQPETALQMIAPLLERSADDVELLAMAGEANLRLRRFTQAARYFERASTIDPGRAALRTALGVSRLGSGELARATAELEQAALANDGSPRAAILLVMTYLRERSFDKALASVESMEQNGDNPLVQNLKGGVHLARGELDKARASFGKSLALDPQYLPAMQNLTQLDVLEKKPDLARQRLKAALSKDRNNTAVLQALAQLDTAHGKQADALAWLERATREDPDALAPAMQLVDFYLRSGQAQKGLVLAQKLQAAHQLNPDVLGLLAQAQYAAASYPASLDSYARLAVLLPKSPTVYTSMANVQLTMDQQDAALESVRKALRLQPSLADAQLIHVGLLLARKDYQQAMAFAAQVQERQPESALGHKLEGDVWIAQGKPQQALKAYERAYAIGKAGPMLVQVHGALLQAGKAAEAEARMTLWLKDHPADVPTRLYYASSKLVRNDHGGAAEQLAAALKHDPKNVVALNDLAWIYQQQNDRRALVLAERAHALAPGNPAIMDTLGWIHLAGGNHARALPLLQKASALAPNALEIRYHLALVLAKAGDKPKARKELERVLAGSKDFPKRDEARALLATL